MLANGREPPKELLSPSSSSPPVVVLDHPRRHLRGRVDKSPRTLIPSSVDGS